MTAHFNTNDNIQAARNFLSLGLPKYAGFAVEFLVSVYIARKLGVESYGIVATVYALVAPFRALQDMGATQILVRDVARDEKLSASYLSASVVLHFYLGLASVVLAFLLSALMGYPAFTRLLVAAYCVALMLETTFMTFISLCVARGRFALAGMAGFFQKLVVHGFPPLALLAGYWVGAFFCFKIVGAALMVFSSLFIIWRLKIRLDFRGHGRAVHHFVAQGYPIAAGMLLFLLSARLDHVMLSKMLTAEAVALYAVSIKILYLSIEAVWGPTVQIMFPVLSRAEKTSVSLMIAKARKYAFFVIAVYGALSLFLTLFGREVILFLWGEQYESSYLSLRIVIWASLFLTLTQLTYRILIVLKARKLYLAAQAVSLVVNFFLNLWLIPVHGFVGAAVSLVCSTGFGFVVCVAIATAKVRGRLAVERGRSNLES